MSDAHLRESIRHSNRTANDISYYVPWHDSGSKLFGICHHKRPTVLLPRNNVVQALGLAVLQQAVELHGKGQFLGALAPPRCSQTGWRNRWDVSRHETGKITIEGRRCQTSIVHSGSLDTSRRGPCHDANRIHATTISC